MDLSNRTAFVTGAAGGIGRASALALAGAGARVMAVDINGAGLEETVRLIGAAGGTSQACIADLRVPDQVDAAIRQTIEQFGSLDCAHNNAGMVGQSVGLADVSIEAFRAVMEINLYGVLNCMQAQIREMLKAGRGVIVNTASISGSLVQAENSSYITSKHAVIGLTRCAALEYGPKNIRINSVSPGFVETALTQKYFEGNDGARDQMVALHPIGRVCQPSEVAEVVLWLCSNRSSYMLGANVTVDGGFSII